MIQVKFKAHERTKEILSLWQYDRGRTLIISGLELPEQVKIEFSLYDKIGETTPRTGITKDGVTEVAIPNILLANEGCRSDYCIFAFIYVEDEQKGFTYRKIVLHVKTRPKPGDYDVPDEAPDYLIAQTKQNTEDINKIREDMLSEETLAEKVEEALTTAKESGEFNGPAGADGKDGTDGKNGQDGASAYEIAVANGFEGTEKEWLTSLVGPEGPQGPEGKQGEQGEQGPAGAQGQTGPQGPAGVKGEKGKTGSNGYSIFYASAQKNSADYEASFYYIYLTPNDRIVQIGDLIIYDGIVYQVKHVDETAAEGNALFSMIGASGSDGTAGLDGADGLSIYSYNTDMGAALAASGIYGMYFFSNITNLNNRTPQAGDLVMDTAGNLCRVTQVYSDVREFDAVYVANFKGAPGANGAAGEAGTDGLSIYFCNENMSIAPTAEGPTDSGNFYAGNISNLGTRTLQTGDLVIDRIGYLYKVTVVYDDNWFDVTYLINLKGEKGEKGDTGEKGETGADGYTPVKGTDYYTEADKGEMVELVLAALPAAEEAVF